MAVTEQELQFLLEGSPRTGGEPVPPPVEVPDFGVIEPEDAPVSEQEIDFLVGDADRAELDATPSATEMSADIESGVNPDLSFLERRVGQPARKSFKSILGTVTLGLAGEDVEKSAEIAEFGVRKVGTGLSKIAEAFDPTVSEQREFLQGFEPTTKTQQAIADLGGGVAKFSKLLGGVTDVIVGALTTVASPFPALAPSFIEKPVEEIFSFLGSLGGEGARKLIEATGGDPESEIGKSTIEAAEVLTQFAPIKAGAKLVSKGKAAVKEKRIERLEKGAEQTTKEILSPTKEKLKAKAEKIAPELAKEKITATTTEGFTKQVRARKDAIGQQIGEFIDSGELKGEIPRKKLLDALEELKTKSRVTTPEGKVVDLKPDTIKAIDGVGDIIREFGEILGAEEILSMKRIWDKSINERGRFDVQKTIDVLDDLNIKRKMTDILREELAKSNPDLAVLNKKFSFYKSALEILDETNRRKVGRTGGLKKVAGKAVGGIVGASGGVFGALAGAELLGRIVTLVESTAWKSVSSKRKIKLAEALVSGEKGLIRRTVESIAKTKKIKEPEEISQ